MTAEYLKSGAITKLNTVPRTSPTTGEGASGYVKTVDDFVVISAAASVLSTYRMVRVASNVKVKKVALESEAQGAGAVNVSVYYGDNIADGLSQTGVIVPTTGDQFFASDVSLATALTPTDVTNEGGNYPLSKRNMPLWQALGLASDPGGFFDIVLVVHTTAITTGTGRTGLRVEFVM